MPQLQEVLYRAAEAGKRSLLPLSPCVESFVCQVGGANDWLIQRDDMRIYTAAEVLFGMHYAEAVTVDDQRRPVADLTRLSLVEPDTAVA